MKREKAEKLFHLLGEIDDDIIAEATVVENKPLQRAWFKQKRNIIRFTTVVASLVFVIMSIWGLGQLGLESDTDNWTADENVGVLGPDVVSEEAEAGDGMTDGSMDDLKINADFSDVVLNIEIAGMMLQGIIMNHSNTTISLSHPSLEYFNGSEWRDVPTIDYLAFEDIGDSIVPGGTYEFNINLERYVMPEGYPLRLRKTVWSDDGWSYGWDQTYLHHDLVYEFEWMDN